jgi:hypothetical protein
MRALAHELLNRFSSDAGRLDLRFITRAVRMAWRFATWSKGPRLRAVECHSYGSDGVTASGTDAGAVTAPYLLLALGLLIAMAVPCLLRPAEGPAARKGVPISSE